MLAKGSFCRFFCDGLDGMGRDGTGWDGVGRRAIRGIRGAGEVRARVESACPGYAGRQNGGFLSALFCPLRWLIPGSLAQIRIAFASPIFLLLLARATVFLSVQRLVNACRAINRCATLSFVRVLRFSFFLHLTRHLRFPLKRFTLARGKNRDAQPGFISKRVDRRGSVWRG